MSSVSDAWPFVIAAYTVAVGGTAAVVGWSFAALRQAERRAGALDRRR